MRHHEVRIGDVEIYWGSGEKDTGQAAEEERHQEADREQHGGLEGQLPLPHGADPVEELDTGGNRDQERHEGEERQQHRAGRVHVVRPHRDRQRSDSQGGEDQRGVTEDRLAAEHREDLRHDSEEW
ncbi:Uncharacterised protein [Mycobacteroides abscessus subsp. abscessus]|nr:Uncharacterised protein [Mycobacteroides abscessus subsp. abscessus]